MISPRPPRTMPILGGNDTDDKEREEPAARLIGSRRPTILLAEDDANLREAISTALRDDGYDVDEAADGGRFLVRVANAYSSPDPRAAFDLIISDVRMPVCTGVQILEGIRGAHWATPVILMTGFRDGNAFEKAKQLGAVLVLKPFDLDDLRSTVVNLLQQGRLASRPTPAPSRV